MKNLSVLLITLFLLTACSSSDPTLDSTEGVLVLAGTYATTVTAVDIIAFDSLEDLTITQGEWIWMIDELGDYIVNLNGLETARGNITIEGDQAKVHISSVSGIISNSSCFDRIGQFGWAQEGGNLSFARIAGTCDAVDIVLTSRPLERRP